MPGVVPIGPSYTANNVNVAGYGTTKQNAAAGITVGNQSSANQAIAFARAQIGKPYAYGATGPNSFDCSGLIQAAYLSAGIILPRTTYSQINVGISVKQNDLQPGDLVFPDAGHVQIYVGTNNGVQQIIEAPHTGASVRLTNIWGFWQARRIVSPGVDIFDTVASNAQNVVNFLDNPGIAIQDAVQALPGFSELETVGKGLSWFGVATNRNRVGVGLAGAVMVIMGFMLLAGENPEVRTAALAVATDGESLAASGISNAAKSKPPKV